MISKEELRKQVLDMRLAMGKDDVLRCSSIICNIVTSERYYKEAQNLCLYMPVKNEVDIRSLADKAWEDGKRVWLPRVDKKAIDFYRYEKGDKLAKGAFNIYEPVSDERLNAEEDTLVIMPGAVFAENRDRVGYGGGYYDRFLAKHGRYHTIAVCYDFQIVKVLNAEKHDIRPQIVISEKRRLREK